MADIVHEGVRKGYTCPVCLEGKIPGTLLCWPCHNRYAREDGMYPERIEAMLDHWEFMLLKNGDQQ